MLDQLRAKYVAQLQELESENLEVLVQERLKQEEEKIRQEVTDEHNDKVLVAKLKVQAVDEMIADQVENEENADNENEENMEV